MRKTWAGIGLGLTSGLVALGAGELVAGVLPETRSPVIDVGDRVIDLVPPAVKDFAIEVFGTADKLILLIGIGLVIAVLASLLGTVALRRPRAAMLGFGGFGFLGAGAALAGGGGVVVVIPSLVAGVAGAGTLDYLARRSTSESTGRRRFLVLAGGMAVGAIAAGLGGRLLRSVLAGAGPAGPLPRPDQALSPHPAGADLEIPGLASFVTPNETFYRIDTALDIPRLSIPNYQLLIGGMVAHPLKLTFEDIVSRPLVEADITLSCVSNEIGGKLVGNARWLGIRLDDLLAEAGIDPAADQIVGRSADAYTCGFPVATLDGRNSLLAIGMNGEPLPLEHGFPVRLVVPGLYGYVSATKWLTEIELTTFAAFDQYWVPRGYSAQAPIKTQSRIDTPKPLARILAGPTTIAGVAWAQTRGIEMVEVRIDEQDWQVAELGAAVNDTTWRQWKISWAATPGRHSLTVRATDGTGEIQTEERTRPAPDGATGWHSVVVLVDG
ncbi:MAG: molybdopterin-dependent oxidoreductase [Acidimicrobiia bacterium]